MTYGTNPYEETFSLLLRPSHLLSGPSQLHMRPTQLPLRLSQLTLEALPTATEALLFPWETLPASSKALRGPASCLFIPPSCILRPSQLPLRPSQGLCSSEALQQPNRTFKPCADLAVIAHYVATSPSLLSRPPSINIKLFFLRFGFFKILIRTHSN